MILTALPHCAIRQIVWFVFGLLYVQRTTGECDGKTAGSVIEHICNGRISCNSPLIVKNPWEHWSSGRELTKVREKTFFHSGAWRDWQYHTIDWSLGLSFVSRGIPIFHVLLPKFVSAPA